MRHPWRWAAPALFVMAWGGNHFTPLLHLYQQAGHYSVVTVDLFLGLYVVGLVPGLLLAGALSDRYGRKPLVIVGIVAGIVASVLLGVGLQSEPLLCIGRLFAGASVGVAMSVGTSWVKELSSSPYENADAAAGARRPSLSLTLGFGIGAGVAGTLAQWGPLPTVIPYAVHGVLSLVALVIVPFVPETVPHRPVNGRLIDDLRVPLASHRRFVRVVVPSAPWVFGAAGVAYAIMPQLVDQSLGRWGLAYATLLTVCTLGSGAAVQPFVRRLNAITGGRALVVGMGIMLLGMLLAVLNTAIRSPGLALGGSLVLGIAYGICVVGGLLEIQRLASPTDLAGITGVYYSLSYLGFLLPVLLSWLSGSVGYGALLGAVALACAVCLALVAVALRRPLPPENAGTGVTAAVPEPQ